MSEGSELTRINDLLIEVNTKLNILINDFQNHKVDDDNNFRDLYVQDKEMLKEIGLIPGKITQSKEAIKTEIMTIARREFADVTDFSVLRSQIKVAVLLGTAFGSVVGWSVSIIIRLLGVG